MSWRRVRGMAAIRRWASEHLREIAPDVVHLHGVDVGYAVSPMAKDLGIGTVLTCHGVFFPMRGRWSVRGRLELALLRRGRYNAVTSIDAASVAALRSVGFSDATLVPNGVRLERFAGPRADGGPFRFLFVGRHEAVKGVDVLLEAATRLREQGRAFRVDLVGDGGLLPRLRARARDLGLDDMVRFCGALHGADLTAAYLGADAFVLPSRHEGFPVTVLEAWAARLPVIATSVGGIPALCPADAAVLVRPEDPAGLAGAMASLMDDEPLRSRLAARGHDLARTTYSWKAIARRYRELYASLG